MAPFVLFELGYPPAVDQGLFRYNPYLLPVIGVSGIVLYRVLLFNNPWFHARMVWIIQSCNITVAFLIFASFVTLTILVLVRGYGYFLSVTKVKIAELEQREMQAPPPLKSPVPAEDLRSIEHAGDGQRPEPVLGIWQSQLAYGSRTGRTLLGYIYST